jgi:hypothetical protein
MAFPGVGEAVARDAQRAMRLIDHFMIMDTKREMVI